MAYFDQILKEKEFQSVEGIADSNSYCAGRKCSAKLNSLKSQTVFQYLLS